MTSGSVSFVQAGRIRWLGEPLRLPGFQRPDLVCARQGVFLFHLPMHAGSPVPYGYRQIHDPYGAAPSFGDPIEFASFTSTTLSMPIHVGADGTFSTPRPSGTGVLGEPGRIHEGHVYIAPDGSGFYVPRYAPGTPAVEIRHAASLVPQPTFSGRVASIPRRADHGLVGAVLDDGALLCAAVPGWNAKKKPFVTKFYRVERDGTSGAVGTLEVPISATDVELVRCAGGAWLTLLSRGRRLVYRVDGTGRVIHGPLDLQKGRLPSRSTAASNGS